MYFNSCKADFEHELSMTFLSHLITVTIAMVIRMKNTMPRLTGPDKVADPRSPMLASHTWNTGAFYTNGSFYPAGKERETGQEMLCV